MKVFDENKEEDLIELAHRLSDIKVEMEYPFKGLYNFIRNECLQKVAFCSSARYYNLITRGMHEEWRICAGMLFQTGHRPVGTNNKSIRHTYNFWNFPLDSQKVHLI